MDQWMDCVAGQQNLFQHQAVLDQCNLVTLVYWSTLTSEGVRHKTTHEWLMTLSQ